MSYQVTDIDHTTLPAALLPDAKLQLRVDFTDDDVFITSLIARAIDLYERKTGLSIFPGTVTWEPDEFDVVTAQGVLCPVQPVIDLLIEDGDGADVTADYKLAGNAVPGRASGLYLQSVSNGTPTAISAGFKTGYEDATKIAPATLDSIMRITAHLYENRESVSDLLLREADWWADDLLVGAWVPRA